MDYALHLPLGGRGFAHMFGAAMSDGAPDDQTGRGHRGGHGHGRRGPAGDGNRHGFGPGGFGPGPGGFGQGRGGRARRGEVRNAALILLAEEPRNGYQIIQELESRSGGRWKPSPGAVYPALSQLEDEGLIRQIPTDTGKLFEITDAGRTAAATTTTPSAWGQDAHTPSDELMRVSAQAWEALGSVARSGDEELVAQAVKELDELKRRLYQLLADS